MFGAVASCCWYLLCSTRSVVPLANVLCTFLWPEKADQTLSEEYDGLAQLEEEDFWELSFETAEVRPVMVAASHSGCAGRGVARLRRSAATAVPTAAGGSVPGQARLASGLAQARPVPASDLTVHTRELCGTLCVSRGLHAQPLPLSPAQTFLWDNSRDFHEESAAETKAETKEEDPETEQLELPQPSLPPFWNAITDRAIDRRCGRAGVGC